MGQILIDQPAEPFSYLTEWFWIHSEVASHDTGRGKTDEKAVTKLREVSVK